MRRAGRFFVLPMVLLVGASARPASAKDDAALPPPHRLRPHREPVRASSADARAEERLDEGASVNFNQLPLEDAIDYLNAVYSLELSVDWQALEKPEQTRSQPITLALSQAPCRVILQLLLEPAQLDWFIADGRATVTTSAQAAEHLSAWKYDIRDLVAEEIPAQELAAAIVGTIAPASWNSAGGPATLDVEEESLIVRSARPAHVELRRLLSGLRREIPEPAALRRIREGRFLTKRYDIRELAGPGRIGDLLVDKLTEEVYPWTWKRCGGSGSLELDGEELVVRQHQWVHDRLPRLLDLLAGMAGKANRGSGIGLQNAIRIWSDHDPDLVHDIERAMTRPVTVRLTEARLRVAMDQIHSRFGVSCWARPEAFTTESGDDVHITRITLRADEAPLGKVLDDALKAVALDWSVVGSGVCIDLASSVAARREVRVYRIKELLDAGTAAADLVSAITRTIEPESWQNTTGTAAIRVLPGFLVVSHNRRAHEQVEGLLSTRFVTATPKSEKP